MKPKPDATAMTELIFAEARAAQKEGRAPSSSNVLRLFGKASHDRLTYAQAVALAFSFSIKKSPEPKLFNFHHRRRMKTKTNRPKHPYFTFGREHVSVTTMTRPIFATRASLARLKGVDIRSKALRELSIDAYLVAGSKQIPLYRCSLTNGPAEPANTRKLSKLTN